MLQEKNIYQDGRVVTRQIASLCVHVELVMERIENYHIFDRTLPVSLTCNHNFSSATVRVDGSLPPRIILCSHEADVISYRVP